MSYPCLGLDVSYNSCRETMPSPSTCLDSTDSELMRKCYRRSLIVVSSDASHHICNNGKGRRVVEVTKY